MTNREVSAEEEPVSPMARFFRASPVDFCIFAIIGFEININPSIFKAGLEQTFVKHPRFSSVMQKVVDNNEGEKMRWIPTIVNIENHVIVPDLDSNMDSADYFVEDYIFNLSKTQMDHSKPLWEIHILNVKTSDAKALVIFRIHHSMGDGASLMSLILACTRKTSDPKALPSVPMKKRAGSRNSGGFWWLLLAIWSMVRLIWNTFVDLTQFAATLMFLKDTKTPLNGAPGIELPRKRVVHRIVSLDDIKLIKNSMNMTVNDVLLGVTQAGLSRYLNRRYVGEYEGAKQKKENLPKSIRLRAIVMVNIRPAAGIQDLADMMAKGAKNKWGNWIGYVFFPFTIALQDDPLNYIRRAKATIDRKKLSLQAMCTFLINRFLIKLFGVQACAAMTDKVFSNTTVTFTNVVGPEQEISFYGHPIAYIATSTYGLPHVLLISCISYVNKMTFCLTVDSEVIPDPQRLCDDLEESLKLIKNTVIKQ